MSLRAGLGMAALCMWVGVTYAPALSLGFIYDDYELIVDREPPASAADLARVFAERHWPTLPYYRPIPRESMLLQKLAHGDSPAPFHAFNVVLVLGAACAAWWLLRTPVLGLPPALAWLAALLFAVHPIASSCVYPIASGRETLWPTLFEMLALAAWLRGRRGVALAVTAAALLSKEHAVVLPVLFVWADLLGVSAEAPGREVALWLRRYAGIVLLVVGYLALRALVFRGAAHYRLAVFSDPAGLFEAFAYALQTVCAPFWALAYEPRLDAWWSAPRFAAAVALCVAIAVTLWRRGRAARGPALFGLGVFAIGLLPTSNLLAQDARFDERYLWFASLGLLALGATALAPLCSVPRLRAPLLVAIGALGLCLAVTSFQRARYFASDEAFLVQWIRSDPGRSQPHVSLGQLALRAHDPAAALTHYTAAQQLAPDSADAYNGAGLALEALGHLDDAQRSFEQAIALEPDNAWPRNNLGILFLRDRRAQDARAAFEAALARAPDDANARVNLALALAQLGDRAGAVTELERVLARRPNHAGACFNRGVLYADAGDSPNAIALFRRALAARPDYALAHWRLSQQLARSGDAAEADAERRRALELDPSLATP
jgi:tetratricopeptide (TPR) repeat protein